MDKEVYDAMLDASIRALPMEACGLLGGNDGHASNFYQLTNVDASGEHYSMRPQEQFAAVKDMRAKSMRLLAIWHSHPATPARMSNEDLRLAYTPRVAYVILSLANAESPVVRGFTVEDGVPNELTVEVFAHPEQHASSAKNNIHMEGDGK